MPKRTFITKATTRVDDPVEFDLGGVTITGESWIEEGFRCLPTLTIAAIEKLLPSAAEFDRIATGQSPLSAVNMGVLYEFFAAVLAGDHYARFVATIRDPDRLMGADDLVEVMEYVLEEVAGRPLDGSRSSGTSPSPTANTSEASST